jgi:hypothetical protein
MLIRVDFTLNVPAAALEALRELSVTVTNADAAEFVRMEASEYIVDYLGSNGVNDVTSVDNTTKREMRRAARS